MITLHHLEYSRSQRIAWLLEELDVPFEVRSYERDPETILAPDELKKVHPLGKSPVITDGDVTVAESGAIMEYLLDKFDKDVLRPPAGSEARREFTYWMHYAEGSFMPLMIVSLLVNKIETAPMPFFVKPVARGITGKIRSGYLDANVERHLAFIEDTLDERSWFAGEQFSAADIQMSFCIEAALARVADAASYPNIAAFDERVKNRGAFRCAENRVGSFGMPG